MDLLADSREVIRNDVSTFLFRLSFNFLLNHIGKPLKSSVEYGSLHYDSQI